MKRFLLLFTNELKLFRTTIPIHLVAIFQPAIMFLLMSSILVHPTFDMYLQQPSTAEGQALAAAMAEVGSPIGQPYIRLHLVENRDPAQGQRQVVSVEVRDGQPTAVQRFGLVDSNMVKNFRNRLTAAALQVWDQALGAKAITVIQRPWLPGDVSYLVYFGMAMLPLGAAMGASILGSILTAQEFEHGTIQEARLSPIPAGLILAARLARVALFGLLGAGGTLLALGVTTGHWPAVLWQSGLVLLAVAVLYGCIGVIAGLCFQRTIPAFLVALVASMVGWLLGSAFGLANGFSAGYASLSQLTPNTQAVALLFPLFFGAQVSKPLTAGLVLAGMASALVLLAGASYRRQVLRQA
ncbi:MAG: hypothetical protein JW862_17930 [Anaerolineales bacterium]|nr:hypothetical protein [Anaerolineales bacterium]